MFITPPLPNIFIQTVSIEKKIYSSTDPGEMSLHSTAAGMARAQFQYEHDS